MVEVDKRIPSSVCKHPTQRHGLGQAARYTPGDKRVYFSSLQHLACVRVRRAAGINDVLVGARSNLASDALLAGEQVDYLMSPTRREHA